MLRGLQKQDPNIIGGVPPPRNPSSAGNDDTHETPFLGFVFLMMLFFGFIMSSLLCYYYQVRRFTQLEVEEQRAIEEQAQRRGNRKLGSRKERYELSEKWLINRKAREHDDCCTICQKASHKLKAVPPINPDENDCPICFIPINKGDIVSWSSNPNCQHPVSHHQCLKEVLVKQRACPFCRAPVLIPDQEKHHSASEQDLDVVYEEEGEKLPKYSLYCLQHGFQGLYEEDLEGVENLESLDQMMHESTPSPEELAALRGIKQVNDDKSDKSRDSDDEEDDGSNQHVVEPRESEANIQGEENE